MKKSLAWTMVMLALVIPVAFGMFIFWLGGNEFVRGEKLADSFLFSGSVGFICSYFSIKLFEGDL